MFYDILDQQRKDILPSLRSLKDRFYLAGGTALALQLGHRDSVDFDFFTDDHFKTVSMYDELLEVFKGRTLAKTLEEKDSLNIVIDDTIKLSLLRYAYPLINPSLEEKDMRIASIEDIGCMKFSAITSRAVEKDYVDLYFILKQVSLAGLLEKAKQKMPDLDHNLILKSLVYFNDVIPEEIMFKHGHEVAFPDVKKFLTEQVVAYKR